jgi:hypothetical protein
MHNSNVGTDPLGPDMDIISSTTRVRERHDIIVCTPEYLANMHKENHWATIGQSSSPTRVRLSLQMFNSAPDLGVLFLPTHVLLMT